MRALIVIPCYNEVERLSPAEVGALLACPRVDVLFVDDGSNDGTKALLEDLAATHIGRVGVLKFEVNRGKAEAVRKGMLLALVEGYEVVGFADADFATPPDELVRLLDELERLGAEIVLGSRVLLLGTAIRRSPLRHIVGRLFATVASLAVGTPVYDTQCGAKLFRATNALRASLAEPFSSRWSFDVELLCRLFGRLESKAMTSTAQALEVPLREWRDVEGSKLDLVSMVKSFGELLGIWMHAKRHSRKH